MHPMSRAGFIAIASLFLHAAQADTVRVMATGLGEGGITAPGINCGAVSGTIDCDETLPATGTITLLATANPGSTFANWGGDCPDADPTTGPNECRVSLASFRSVRAQFNRSITPLTETQIADVAATRSGIGDYLAAHTDIDTVAEFIAALPVDYRRNWILMPRSESLQTGMAAWPRVLLPNAEATNAFAVGLRQHGSNPADPTAHVPSYPAAYPTAVEFMQWDEAQKTFRFHEIALTALPARDDTNPDPTVFAPRFLGRARGVSIDDTKCFACHSTRNVFNNGTTPGTDGVSRDIPVKMKPNWDAYDSWGGMLPFNRDRIYKGSLEAAAFRHLFNLWNWRDEPAIRGVVEQLEFQPPGVPDGSAARRRRHNRDDGTIPALQVVVDDRITRNTLGGPDDGRIVFPFDAPGPPVTTEPQPTGSGPTVTYQFDRRVGTAGTTVLRDSGATEADQFTKMVTLHHTSSPLGDAGRGVMFLFNLSDNVNTKRVVDEVKTHRFATGSTPIDVRPLTLAIAAGCISATGGTDITATQGLSITLPPAAQTFFDARNGMSFDGVYDDTRRRQTSLTLRKSDIQKLTLDRTGDTYVFSASGPAEPVAPEIVNGMILQYGGATSGVAGGTGGLDTDVRRLRQEVFRRGIDRGGPDQTVMGGVLVDREIYNDFVASAADTAPLSLVGAARPLALFRYFLEPLGVSVDKWSTSVRGRSRTYTFSASFGSYLAALASPEPGGLRDSLGIPAAASPADVCTAVMPMVTASLAALPLPDAMPTYTDIQRIFNKSCIECHGGLGYPPYRNYAGPGVPIDFTENENPAGTERRLERSYNVATSLVAAGLLYEKITDDGLLAHPYNPGQPYNIADPDGPAPDVADERCPEGLMPCGGPPLSKVDIETIRRWIVGSTPYTEGDPHLHTVDGTYYDFQSSGEFTLLRDAGMELQARQTPVPAANPITDAHTGLTSCVSINSAVALKVGRHRVTYQPDLAKESRQPGGLILRIDGKPVDAASRATPLEGGGRVLRTAAGGIQVQYPGGTAVIVTPGTWLGVSYMNVNITRARATEGIMGAIAPGNWLPALPDGTLLGARPADIATRHATLYKRFADAWRVTETTSLFDYESGLSPGAFVAKDWPEAAPQVCRVPQLPGVPIATTPPQPLPVAEAEKLCDPVVEAQRRKNCVADVTATGAREFAQTYLATERQLNRPRPAAPELRTPANNATIPATDMRFDWTNPVAQANDGLTIRHCLWSADQLYDFNKCTVLDEHATPWQSDWRIFALIAVLALLLALILWFAARARFIAVQLLALAVALWAGWQLYLVQTGRTPGTITVEQVAPGKIYFWRVVAEDAEGNLVESKTRRLVVK